jgi:hypothetical protein
LLWIIPFIVNFIAEKLDASKGDPMFLTIISLFLITNVCFALYFTSYKRYKRVIFSFLVVIVGVGLSAIIIRYNILPIYDPYGIMTFIFGNGIFSVLTWEVIFQLSSKKIKLGTDSQQRN